MIDCLVLGDSIAVGIQEQLPTCELRGEVGITSTAYLQRYGGSWPDAVQVIVSLGANDFGIPTYENLARLRDRIDAEEVVWVMPAMNDPSALAVARIAYDSGDRVVQVDSVSLRSDGVHPTPTGYRNLAAAAANR